MSGRSTLYFSLFFIFIFSCKTNQVVEKPVPKPTKPRSTLLPLDFVEGLRKDAAYITLTQIKRGHEGPVELADLPEKLIEKYQRMLIMLHEFAIQNKDIPQIRDIQSFPSPDLNRILVVLEKNASFLEFWKKGIATSDNLYLNQMLTRYEISVTEYKESPLGSQFILRSENFINTEEFAKAISNIEGIRLVEPEGYFGDGDRIYVSGDSKKQLITFSKGYGDCPSGCIHRANINFEIIENRVVKYLGINGDPLPEEK